MYACKLEPYNSNSIGVMAYVIINNYWFYWSVYMKLLIQFHCLPALRRELGCAGCVEMCLLNLSSPTGGPTEDWEGWSLCCGCQTALRTPTGSPVADRLRCGLCSQRQPCVCFSSDKRLDDKDTPLIKSNQPLAFPHRLNYDTICPLCTMIPKAFFGQSWLFSSREDMVTYQNVKRMH